MNIFIIILFFVLYVTSGITLENLGFTSPAFYSFHGFVLGVIYMGIIKWINNKG
jgi:hypothetical protein